MAQPTITSYFSNRKRAATDDFKLKSKVLVLDQSAAPLGYDANSTDISQQKQVTRKIVVARSKPSNTQVHDSKPAARISSSKGNKDAKQPDLTNFFKKPESLTKNEETPKETEASTKPTVPFEVRGPLSPIKHRPESAPEPPKSKEPEVAPPAEPKLKESAVQKTCKARKELSLEEIKTRIIRSSRLGELKEKLARVERGREQLLQLERNEKTPVQPDASPRLNKFHIIEVEVPASPTKSPLLSPQKLLASPRRAGLESPSKAAAYERFAALASLKTPETKLILPHSYRILAELFRCVDYFVSRMSNRGETVTFETLKQQVQNMRKKTFGEHHFGQMMTVLPNAFAVKRAKVRSRGFMTKEKYEIVITPLLKSDNGPVPAERNEMTAAVVAERMQDFKKSLLEITKDHHDKFLRSLDPPMFIAKDRVTRWHPDFPVDSVSEVTPFELPAPPVQKISSFKDVLAQRPHHPSIAKALERAANRENTVTVEVVDANPNTPSTPPTPVKSNIRSALAGLPKALLDKIRAREAAKALECMTRSATQDKEAVQYSRLPKIARILRSCYTVEKKSVLPLETVVQKVATSYRSNISGADLEEHLRLLAKEVPQFISFEDIRKTEYVRLNKDADRNEVMERLESLATQKTGISV